MSDPVPSAVVRVTLFEDRAEVVRRAHATLGETVSIGAAFQLVVAGVSPYVDDRSVQARVDAPAAGVRVTAARVVRRVHDEAALGREQIDALEREARDARTRAEQAALARVRAGEAEARAAALRAQWIDAVARVPPGAREPDGLDGWTDGLRAIEQASRDALDAQASARDQASRAEHECALAEQRLAEGRARTPRYEAQIEVQLVADEAGIGDVALELVYRVPCALWRPEHLARLDAAAGDVAQGSLELTTYATAWQRTGEAWDDVAVSFSTARPARAASPPVVREDVLATRRKAPIERQTITVEARDQTIALAGLGHGARELDEMPGVDDGGEPLQFAPRERVTIPSDGRPFRVEIARATMRAEVARVVVPERAPVAHIRATATLPDSSGAILAGPVRVARGGSLVGRGRVEYVARGEPFELGFGPDDGVRVRRTQDEQRETTALVGTQKLRRTVRVYLSNLSGEAKQVRVTERVPVSEIEDVEVSLLESAGWRFESRDGFARAEVDIPARGHRSLTLVYEVRAGARVAMPF